MKQFFILIVSFFLVASCASHKEGENKEQNIDSLIACATKIDLKYSRKFSLYSLPDSAGYLLRVVNSDSTNSSVDHYCLMRKNRNLKVHSVPVLEIPLTRITLSSSTHLEFIRMLGSLSALRGMFNEEYIYSDSTLSVIQKNDVVEMGDGFNVDMEKLLLVSPELMFVSDEREKIPIYDWPVLVCQEWNEPDALGRAEWIKAFAALFDKLEMGDSLFQDIEKNYLKWKNLAATDSVRPSLFAAGAFGDTWYLTGGKGYMSSIYQDANAQFCLADTMVSTVTCGLEWLMTHYQNVDVWMNCQTKHLMNIDPRLSILKSYQTGNVYHFNKRSKQRSNVYVTDFYESAVAHPDVVLADVVSVLHPNLMPGYESVYLDKVK